MVVLPRAPAPASIAISQTKTNGPPKTKSETCSSAQADRHKKASAPRLFGLIETLIFPLRAAAYSSAACTSERHAHPSMLGVNEKRRRIPNIS